MDYTKRTSPTYGQLFMLVTLTFPIGLPVAIGKGHSHPLGIASSSLDTRLQPKRHGAGHRQSASHEHCLMQQLMRDYDPSVRPVYDPKAAVDVLLGLTLKKILDLDEKNQILTTNVWLDASWHDDRLNWSSAKYGGIESIRIPPHKIWLPDIVLYNSVDDYTSGYMPSLAMVYNNSRVFWGPVIRFRSACKIDITYFPFDNQICKMKIGSWAYNGLQVNIWNTSSNMDLSNYVDNGEWELLAAKEKRNVVFYACCKEPFPDVTITIVLRRRTKYYFMNILIPCILLSFMCLGGFLLPPDSGERITLGLSVLLTITVFMLMVADRMPQTSESISVISVYLMAVLCTSCMSVLSSVLVLSIHHQRQPVKVPAFLRWLCFEIFGRIFRLTEEDAKTSDYNYINADGFSNALNGDIIITQSQRTSELSSDADNDDEDYDDNDNGDEDNSDEENDDPDGKRIRQILSKYSRDNDSKLTNRNGTRFRYFEDDAVVEKVTAGLCSDNKGESESSHILRFPDGRSHAISTSSPYKYKPQSTLADEVLPVPNTRGRFQSPEEKDSNLDLVSEMARILMERETDEAEFKDICQEWHNLAYILDRMLFAFFLALTVISTVCILQMRPSQVEL